MGPEISTVAFDADDTLWHNERIFRMTQARFAELLADHAPREALEERLLAAERCNLPRYGFGIKGFTLSMVETALDVTGDAAPAPLIRELLDAGKEMLAHPIELLPEAHATVAALAGRFHLILITKGDLLDQERKLAESGLGEKFDAVEIVSDKTPETYERVFARHEVAASAAVMVGNSLKSDVIPALEAGAWAVHVPHDLTWAAERAERPTGFARFREIESLGALAPLLASLSAGP